MKRTGGDRRFRDRMSRRAGRSCGLVPSFRRSSAFARRKARIPAYNVQQLYQSTAIDSSEISCQAAAAVRRHVAEQTLAVALCAALVGARALQPRRGQPGWPGQALHGLPVYATCFPGSRLLRFTDPFPTSCCRGPVMPANRCSLCRRGRLDLEALRKQGPCQPCDADRKAPSYHLRRADAVSTAVANLTHRNAC